MDINENNVNNTSNKSEFWRDIEMDTIIKTIIEIFTGIEGVELVRISGLTKYINKISNKHISGEDINIIIEKLYQAKIINYCAIYICPHCNEKSYIIKEENKTTKLCDTCKTFYELINNVSYFKK